MDSHKKNRYNWAEIQKFYDQCNTRKEILEEFGIHTNTLYSAIKRGDLIYKSKFDQFDWLNIQKYYDSGKTWEETQEKFNLNVSQLNKAKKLGLFKSRNKSEARKNSCKNGRSVNKRSEATKNKISESMIKFLLNNPDKVPYLKNHSSKKSYPEKIFENALNSCNITGWVYNYQNGLYQYDFAWPDKKIDVEIDGGTHTLEKVKKIDERRDAFSKEHGWIVIRFEAKIIKNDVVSCINELKKYL